MPTFCSKGDFGPGKSGFSENVPGFSYTFLGTKRLLQALFLPRKEAYSLPNKQFSTAAPQSAEGENTERVPLSYACYETFSFVLYNTAGAGIAKGANLTDLGNIL